MGAQDGEMRVNGQHKWWKDVAPEAWRPFGQSDVLFRERYTAVLAALEALSTRNPMSTLTEIGSELQSLGYRDPLPEPELRAALEQLSGWTLVEPFRDYAATMASLRELRQRQEAWALTHLGRAVVAAVRTATADARRALQLPPRLLDSVEETIRMLLSHFADQQDRLPGDLTAVRARIDEMQRVTADFYASLAQLVQSDVTDDSVFGVNRDRVMDALRQFPVEYERGLRSVESALTDLEAAGPRSVIEAASHHAGILDSRSEQDWIEENVRLVEDLTTWFASDGAVSRLVQNATGAVQTLLLAIDRRFNARRRGSDIGLDFRDLAVSLYAQSDDEAARRVWAAAFGDWPAHHPRVGPPVEDISTAPVTLGGARFHVDVTLREHERSGPIGGRAHRVPDVTSTRKQALREALAEAVRQRDLADALVTDGLVSLDHYEGLEAEPAAVLLAAIESALASYDHAAGAGEADVEHAAARIRVVEFDRRRCHLVRLAEGTLKAPYLRLSVTRLSDVGAASGGGTRDESTQRGTDRGEGTQPGRVA